MPRRARRVALFVSAATIVILIATSAWAATTFGRSGSGEPAVVADVPIGTPVAIFPSDREPAPPPRRVPRRLFSSGLTLEAVAKPACERYRRVRRSWAKRAEFIHESSLGAATSTEAAVEYYAGVTWLSQDEAGDFANAIARISSSRLSYATDGLVKRGRFVASFTREALAVCDLSADYARTLEKLDRLDLRVARILELAHFPGSGPAEGLAQ